MINEIIAEGNLTSIKITKEDNPFSNVWAVFTLSLKDKSKFYLVSGTMRDITKFIATIPIGSRVVAGGFKQDADSMVLTMFKQEKTPEEVERDGIIEFEKQQEENSRRWIKKYANASCKCENCKEERTKKIE